MQWGWRGCSGSESSLDSEHAGQLGVEADGSRVLKH